MSIFDRFYERPSFDFSRIGSSPEPSNQPMQSFNENEEDMEAEALLDQFLADGVITDEERSILGGLGLSGAAFAAQTGRAPTPRPIVPSKSELAQRIAANDAAREAASKAAPRAASRSASRASAAASRAASRAAPRAASTATRLARVGGPGALLFGAFDALQVRMQTEVGAKVPSQVFLAAPYVLSIVDLVIAARRAEYPRALLTPWFKGQR